MKIIMSYFEPSLLLKIASLGLSTQYTGALLLADHKNNTLNISI
jgi:hypothetical protein